jgi:hypothetical protein
MFLSVMFGRWACSLEWSVAFRIDTGRPRSYIYLVSLLLNPHIHVWIEHSDAKATQLRLSMLVHDMTSYCMLRIVVEALLSLDLHFPGLHLLQKVQIVWFG